MSFISSEAVEFVVVKPNEIDTVVAQDSIYSHLKRAEAEYFLTLVVSGVNVVYEPRETLNSRGHAFETLPVGTELRLDGTAARSIPLGLNRSFRTSELYLRGEAAGNKVWVAVVDFTLLAKLVEQTADPKTRQALVAVGLLMPDTFEEVELEKWRCPQ